PLPARSSLPRRPTCWKSLADRLSTRAATSASPCDPTASPPSACDWQAHRPAPYPSGPRRRPRAALRARGTCAVRGLQELVHRLSAQGAIEEGCQFLLACHGLEGGLQGRWDTAEASPYHAPDGLAYGLHRSFLAP